MKDVRTINQLEVSGKRVLVRVDFNVTLQKNEVSDDTRIRHGLSTIQRLLSRGASLILVTHLGRPNGRRVKKYSVRPVARRLEDLLNKPIKVVDDFTQKSSARMIRSLTPGDIVLLENIRFYQGEEQNNPDFSKQLASLAQAFVFDAFGTAHRVHASTVGVSKYLPRSAGLLMEKEIKMIQRLTDHPKRPFVAIIGGAKAETKIRLIERLLEMTDQLLIGGGIANTFFKAWGFPIGRSYANHEVIELARTIIWKASQSKTALTLPKDVVIGSIRKNAVYKVVPANRIPSSGVALDIGPQTQALFASSIADAKTIVWNGPMGVYEQSKFRIGTDFIFHAIAANRKAFSLVGGGDTLASMSHKHLVSEIDHLSTGGGSLLEFIEKGTLPAIEALKNNS